MAARVWVAWAGVWPTTLGMGMVGLLTVSVMGPPFGILRPPSGSWPSTRSGACVRCGLVGAGHGEAEGGQAGLGLW